MIWHKNQKPPTALEQLRIDAMMKGGCYLSLLRRHLGLPVPTTGIVECQHITRGRKRLGHLYTIPLHSYYHRGVVPHPAQSKREALELYGASLADGSKAFKNSHGLDELELWQSLQRALGDSAELPKSKVLPRRAA